MSGCGSSTGASPSAAGVAGGAEAAGSAGSAAEGASGAAAAEACSAVDGGTPSCPPPPTLEIVDRKTGAVISGTTQTKIVGQKIQLLVRSKPTGHAVSSPQWNIPAQIVKDYTQSTATGVKTDLASADLQSLTIDFHWIDGGSKTVQVSGQVDGSALTASVTYNVLRPTMDKFAITTSSSSVMLNHFASPGNPVLGAYQAPKVGCQWDAKVTAPAAGGGKIGFTQRINVNRHWTNNAGVTRNLTSGKLVLDHALGIQYSGPQSIAAGASATLNGPNYSDSPWIPLLVGDQSANAAENFELYLMYKHQDADSIWVTLGLTTWNWGGSTTRAGAPAATTNNWNPATGATLSPSGTTAAGDSTQLPVWVGNFGTAVWS